MGGYYHLSVRIISRGKGRSAVACSAYRAGAVLEDLRYGSVHDYRPRKGIIATGLLAPEEAPSWAKDRGSLWNELEAFERRKDAQLAREFVLGLPCQLSHEEHKEAVEQFIQQELLPRGLVADYAIHAPNRKGDERNHHAHIMATIRSVTEEGFMETKDRSMNSRELLTHWREAWADIQNERLERNGVRDAQGQILKVDHRSYKDQGLDLEPTLHLGVHATAMERAGKRTEIGDTNRAIRNANDNALRRREASRLTAREAAASLDALNKNLEAAEILRKLNEERERGPEGPR